MNKGRPTKYKPEYIEKAEEYISLKQDEVTRVVKYESSKGTGYEDRLTVELPTIEGFARFIGVNKTTLYEWEKENEDFSNALNKIRLEQKERLINSGLSGAYNSTIAKLILSSNHGMAEKTQNDHTTGGKPISILNSLHKKEEE